MKSPILSTEKLVKQGHRYEAGPTGCKMCKGDRRVTLDVVKTCLWVDVKAHTTAEGARKADEILVVPVVSELPVEPSSGSSPNHTKFSRQLAHLVGHQLNTSTVLHQLRTCEHDCERCEHQCGARKHSCGVVLEREVIERRTLGRRSFAGQTTSLGECNGPNCTKDHEGTRRTGQTLNAQLTKSRISHRRGATLGRGITSTSRRDSVGT